MTTTTKPTFTFLKTFNGHVISTETRLVPRTLRGLHRVIANVTGWWLGGEATGMSAGWGLWLAPESREAVIAWVAAQLGGHDGDARRWLAERRVGGID